MRLTFLSTVAKRCSPYDMICILSTLTYVCRNQSTDAGPRPQNAHVTKVATRFDPHPFARCNNVWRICALLDVTARRVFGKQSRKSQVYKSNPPLPAGVAPSLAIAESGSVQDFHAGSSTAEARSAKVRARRTAV